MQKYLLLIALCLLQAALSQTPTNSELSFGESLSEDQPLAFHLQTNKTIYHAGEEIWFTVYAFDRLEGLVYTSGMNAFVQLFDSQKKQISSNLYWLQQGTDSGSIILKPTLPDGIYTLSVTATQDSTKDIAPFTQSIKIINPETPVKIASTTKQPLDIQVLPEGGHLVTDLMNTCGIKILNQLGKGVEASNIVLRDDTGAIVLSDIKTNRLGMGRFQLVPKLGRRYQIEYNEQTIALPYANQTGLILSTTPNFKTGDLNISLNINDATLAQWANEDISVVIRKDGRAQNYTVQFETDYPKINFQIPNKKLYPGVNTITVFDKNKRPILERMFFNHKSIPEVTTYATQVSKKQDTFSYTLLHKMDDRPLTTTTSVSVLPATTKANLNRESIYASVYLKPYLKGTIEDPAYYFTRNNYQKQYEIDLLLLNQGWSKYSWDDFIEDATQDDIALGDSGIALTGYVRAHKERDIPAQVLLYSKDNRKLSVKSLDDESRFILDKLPLTKGTKLNFSALDKNGIPIKANFFYTVAPKLADSLALASMKSTDYFKTYLNNSSTQLFAQEREQLDTVVLTTQRLKYEKYFAGWDGRKMTPKEKSRGNLRNFMATYGYYVIFDENAIGRRFGKWVMNPNGRGSNFLSPAVVVDGIPYNPMDIGEMISLQDVDEIYADRRGKVHTFIVFTNGIWNRNPEDQTSKSFVLNEGLTPKREFYTPRYSSYNSLEYQHFGVISWEPELRPNRDGYSEIEVYNPGAHDLLIYTEGVTEEGKPIASVVKVGVEGK